MGSMFVLPGLHTGSLSLALLLTTHNSDPDASALLFDSFGPGRPTAASFLESRLYNEP